MKIICKNPRNIIIAVAFACVCLAGAETAEAGCYRVCDPMYATCPSGYSVWQNQGYPWAFSPWGWACFPCGGYGCFLGSAWGHVGGPVCATSLYSGCIDIGPYLTGWNCYDRCDGECNNSVRYGCTVPNSTTASIPQGDDANFWYWYCPGKNFGANSPQCSFAKPSPTDGQCGNTKDTCITSTPATLKVETTTLWTWTCPGSGGGKDKGCSLDRPIDGSCQTFPSGVDPLPTASNQLCATGTASAVSGLGTYEYPWTWTCFGSSGGADDPSCSAKKPCEYTEYKCTRSSADVTCEDTYPENCEKILPVNKICHATDRFNSCPPLSQSDCKAAAGSSDCDNTTETCASCPINPGAWREVSPQN